MFLDSIFNSCIFIEFSHENIALFLYFHDIYTFHMANCSIHTNIFCGLRQNALSKRYLKTSINQSFFDQHNKNRTTQETTQQKIIRMIFLARSQSYKNRIESIERRARVVIKSNNLTVDLRIPKIDAVIRKRACTLVFDNLQQNVCDVMKEYFTKNKHGRNTRNEELSVKLPLMKKEFGRRGSISWLPKNTTIASTGKENRITTYLWKVLDSHFNDI